jgi:hypothetical protein
MHHINKHKKGLEEFLLCFDFPVDLLSLDMSKNVAQQTISFSNLKKGCCIISNNQLLPLVENYSPRKVLSELNLNRIFVVG